MKPSTQGSEFDLSTDLDFSGGVDLSFGDDAPPPALALPESFEDAVKEETSEFLAAFRKRSRDEEAKKEANISTDYWFAVYFASPDQRDDFLRKIGVIEKMYAQYLDGRTLAEALGVSILPQEITTPRAFRSPAGIDDLIMDI